MSDLLTRLGEFPIVRKDGTAFAGKLIQSVLKLIDDGHSEIVWEEAVRLLCIFISFFPFSISRHYDSVSGICVRLFLKDPKFSLRNPKRFLEGLLDQYLSSIAATHSETQAVDPELPLQIILDTLHLCPNLWLLWQCGPNFLSSLWS